MKLLYKKTNVDTINLNVLKEDIKCSRLTSTIYELNNLFKTEE